MHVYQQTMMLARGRVTSLKDLNLPAICHIYKEILHTHICKGIALVKEVMVNVQVCIMSLANLLKTCLEFKKFHFCSKLDKSGTNCKGNGQL